jgi:hypothetical protein
MLRAGPNWVRSESKGVPMSLKGAPLNFFGPQGAPGGSRGDFQGAQGDPSPPRGSNRRKGMLACCMWNNERQVSSSIHQILKRLTSKLECLHRLGRKSKPLFFHDFPCPGGSRRRGILAHIRQPYTRQDLVQAQSGEQCGNSLLLVGVVCRLLGKRL